MTVIHLLDHNTIDKIAAREVVERPSSIVKELVENAMDAGSTAITVEIKEGGISFIRVSDNGCGIDKSEIRKAFLRHATSKITSAQDLHHLTTLGFRGEALSSISAVSQVELITKTKKELTGIRLQLEGAIEQDLEEIGAPDGTTVIVRNLFFNVPVRKKFLKQPATEGGYIADLMEHLALSNPLISFQFIQNGTVKFNTSGNGNLKQIIYNIYGKDTADSLIEIREEKNGIKIHGFLGKPGLNRATRSHEIYFVNHRFVKNNILSKAIEDGYKSYVMQHKYPFCVLMFQIPPEEVDVNIHPTKMDIRFSKGDMVYQTISEIIREKLGQKELIPEVQLVKEEVQPQEKAPVLMPMMHEPSHTVKAATFTAKDFSISFDSDDEEAEEEFTFLSDENQTFLPKESKPSDINSSAEAEPIYVEEQLNLFEEKIIQQENRPKFQIIGQVFDTYWIILYEEKMLLVDQHAAHEKVKYERFMNSFSKKQIETQNLFPPVVVCLSMKEASTLKEHIYVFEELGFEIEFFGGNDITIRCAPVELYGNTLQDLFLEVLDDLTENGLSRTQSIYDRIATMSCKAAVKGNSSLSKPEMEALLDELFTLENPYFCPHGRPTMIYFTKQELEKKFKRIV